MNMQYHRNKLNRILSEYRHQTRMMKEEKAQLASYTTEYQHSLEAQLILQEIAQKVQQQAHTQISKIVSKCLKTVFQDDAYNFQIKFLKRRGKTEARLVFVRNGKEIDPVSAAGGGVIDVASFALRLAALLLSTPRRRRLIVADEPFRCLSRDYAPRVRELLETLSRELGIQMILVTHSELLACGKVIRIGDGP